MFCEFSCKARIVILMLFSDKNILRINVFARNMRNIVYSCTHMFNDCIFDILCTVLFYNFFCNISSFLCLISWLSSIESVYSRFLRRVFMWSLMRTFSSRYFLRIISLFSIYNFECMISSIFFIIFASLFLMF